MQSNYVRSVLIVAIALTFSGAFVESSYAQAPGAPQVTLLPDNSAVISYEAPVAPPPSTVLVATFNGAPAGSFAIGTLTTVYTGTALPPGDYTVQIVWSAEVASPVTPFTVGAPSAVGRPGATILHPASLSANNVTINWDAVPGAAGYEVEAVMFENGQVFRLSVGDQTSLVVPDVPFGNYTVRVRARNVFGFGPYSNQILVTIAATIRLKDLDVTLTWNSLADLDLHIIEPNGNHVYWDRRSGLTTRFEGLDNTTGFGPETISIAINGAALGVYQIFIVHYRGVYPTTATIAVTLGVGTPNVRTEIFTRQTSTPSATAGYNVALVDVRGGVIGEVFGTREALSVGAERVKPE